MRKIQLVPGSIYHLYNRGVNHQNVFFIRANWIFFLRRLRESCPQECGEIVTYCLMPNHYHLLIKIKAENFGATVMQPFTVSYTKAINKQEERIGPLFQGPFKARLVERDGDVIHLSRYIHLNPVTAGFVKRPEEWEFSSYRDYIGLRSGTLPKMGTVLQHFAPPSETRFLKEAQQKYAAYVGRTADPQVGLSSALLIDDK